MIEITIKADTNDADYICQTGKISKKQLNKFRPLIEQIRTTRSNNWCTSSFVDNPPPEIMYDDIKPEIIEEFSEFVPCGENGVHSIVEIKVREITVINEERLV